MLGTSFLDPFYIPTYKGTGDSIYIVYKGWPALDCSSIGFGANVD